MNAQAPAQMPEFKPCPFCGQTPKLVTRDVEPQCDAWYGKKVETFVLCDCGCCLFDGEFHEGFYDAETRAAAAWNSRAERVEAVPDLLAALRGLLNALPSATTHPAIKAARAAIAAATEGHP